MHISIRNLKKYKKKGVSTSNKEIKKTANNYVKSEKKD